MIEFAYRRTADLSARGLALACLALMMSGCHKHVKAAASVAPPPAVFVGEGAPPVAVPPPTHVTPEGTLEFPVSAPSETPDKARPVRKPAPAKPATAQPGPTTPPAVSTPSPAIDMLGTLSAGGDVSPALRNATSDLLRAVHQRMDRVPVDKQGQHHDQFERVKNFVRQADDAWQTGDVEGARTLATKARVLLDEVQQ